MTIPESEILETKVAMTVVAEKLPSRLENKKSPDIGALNN